VPSAASLELSLSVGRGVDVGVGPVLLRTVSWGAVVSARVLVMVVLAGEAGGESDEVVSSGAVCRREGVGG
jgi:hypothetical protein